jgi:hypothetical protein
MQPSVSVLTTIISRCLQANMSQADSNAVFISVERELLERMTGALYHIFAACGSSVPQQALQQVMEHCRMAQLVKFVISSRQEVGPQVVSHVIGTMATCGEVQQAFLPDIKASNAQGWLYQLLTDYLGVLGTSREGSWQQQRHADSQAAVRGIKELDTACRSAAAATATLLLALGGDARAAALELLPQLAEAVPLLCPDDRQTTACWLAAHTAALKHAHGNATRKTAGAEDAERLAGLVETYAEVGLGLSVLAFMHSPGLVWSCCQGSSCRCCASCCCAAVRWYGEVAVEACSGVAAILATQMLLAAHKNDASAASQAASRPGPAGNVYA